MKYLTFAPTASVPSSLETEIMFAVASARAQGNDFLKIDLSEDKENKSWPAVQRQLKLLKKQGRIQFFVDTVDLYGTSTEAQYLANKHPEVFDICGREENAFIIKI